MSATLLAFSSRSSLPSRGPLFSSSEAAGTVTLPTATAAFSFQAGERASLIDARRACYSTA